MTSPTKSEQCHASCVMIADTGVLIRGPSGSGKSDLALRLIDQGARLIADDRTNIRIQNNRIIAAAPPNIAGMIEVRGLGIVTMPFVDECALTVVIELTKPEHIERLPDQHSWQWGGVELPRYAIAPFEPSAAAKVRVLVKYVLCDIMSVS